jgi:hypothetical protein
MSPEQAAGVKLGPATDWYSVGVMLHEALTGQLPFEGSARFILSEKQRRAPEPPSALVSDLPKDLESLCMGLLSPDPALRPSGQDVLERLGGRHSGAGARGRPAGTDIPLVGRESELRALYAALDAASAARTTTVFVHGSSGVGKSELVNYFVREIRGHDECLVLEGRCYERESVPFKSLDELIDNLNRYLKTLPDQELKEALPADIPLLARLFPILREIVDRARCAWQQNDIPEAKEVRLHAFRALQELLATISRRRTLVLLIDDLQWGDADSAPLLIDLLRPAQAIRLLFLACYRTEEAETSPLLGTLLSRQYLFPGGGTIDLPLSELRPAAARDLASILLVREGTPSDALAEEIARESGGNPFFIRELVKSAWVALPTGSGNQSQTAPLSLEDMLRARVTSLSDPARRMLEIVAVAGQPVDVRIAKAAALSRGGARADLVQLSSARLIRIRKSGAWEEVEAYHDRIRQAATALLEPAARMQCHHRLALQWETSDHPDCGALAIHFGAAGVPGKARRYAIQAAGEAATALAFENAAHFYRFALDLSSSEDDAAPLYEKLADALGNAGRGAESAEAYLHSAAGACGDARLELQRRAATQFMISGRIDRSLGLIREVLEAIGMKFPQTPWRALASFFLQRVLVRARGLRYKERSVPNIRARDMFRVDVCWSVVQGLAMVDTIRALPFQAKGILLALRCGEPYRTCRALCAEAGYFAISGWRHRQKVERILAEAKVLAARSHNAHGAALVALTEGIATFLSGRWSSAVERMAAAETLLRERCLGVSWEIATSHMMGNVSLFHMGRWKELSERLPRILEDAEKRGDLFEITDLKTRLSHAVWLAADQPERAYAELDASIALWGRTNFDLKHWWALMGRIEINLYAGEPRRAWNHVQAEWPALRRSFLMRVEYVAIESFQHRARVALALAASGTAAPGERGKLLRTVRRDVRRIERRQTPWGNALAALLRAGIAANLGRQENATSLLNAAEAMLQACDMSLYAAAARRVRGTMVEAGGRDLVDTADVRMSENNVRNPERVAAMLVSGFPSRNL